MIIFISLRLVKIERLSFLMDDNRTVNSLIVNIHILLLIPHYSRFIPVAFSHIKSIVEIMNEII